MSNRNQTGRSAKKRWLRKQLRQMANETVTNDQYDADSIRHLRQVGEHLIAQKRQLLYQSYRRELSKRSVLLGTKGCWAFYEDALPEAKRWQLGDQLRQLVALYAARFVAAGNGTVANHFE